MTSNNVSPNVVHLHSELHPINHSHWLLIFCCSPGLIFFSLGNWILDYIFWFVLNENLPLLSWNHVHPSLSLSLPKISTLSRSPSFRYQVSNIATDSQSPSPVKNKSANTLSADKLIRTTKQSANFQSLFAAAQQSFSTRHEAERGIVELILSDNAINSLLLIPRIHCVSWSLSVT